MAEFYQYPNELRDACRRGEFVQSTAAQTPGYEQANIIILPQEFADDFARYCELNPQACPLLSRGKPGDPSLPELGAGIDIRFDLPRYRVFEEGRHHGDYGDVSSFWRDDLVTFALGCSLSFEKALEDAGVNLRYFRTGEGCAAYRSTLATTPAGPFRGDMVVTFRAVPKDQVELSEETTLRYPLSHGGPVHMGSPAEIGIGSLQHNIDGIGCSDLRENELAVFWACGVTAVDAVQNAAPDLAITHAPAHMLVTDREAYRATP